MVVAVVVTPQYQEFQVMMVLLAAAEVMVVG